MAPPTTQLPTSQENSHSIGIAIVLAAGNLSGLKPDCVLDLFAARLNVVPFPVCEEYWLAGQSRNQGQGQRTGVSVPHLHLASLPGQPRRLSPHGPCLILVQEELPVERIPLRRPEACIANDSAQLFFCRAVGHAGGSHYIFFQHHRADIVAAEAQAHLADFQALRDPTGLHVQEVRKIKARDSEDFQVFDGGGFVPVTAAEGGVLRLKAPRDEGGEAAGFFLQVVKFLQVVDAVFVILADAEHHGGGGAHADLVGGAVNVDPVVGEALEARDFIADFVVENFGAAAGDGIESGIAQAKNRVTNAEAAVLGNGDDLGRGVAMQMDLRKAVFNSAQHSFVPIDFEVGMKAALHQHAGAAEFDGLADFFVDGVKFEYVTFFCGGAFERAIESAEGAVLGAEVGVVNVAVDDVSDGAFRMQLAAQSVGFHADADQVVGVKHLQGLGFGEGHGLIDFNGRGWVGPSF